MGRKVAIIAALGAILLVAEACGTRVAIGSATSRYRDRSTRLTALGRPRLLHIFPNGMGFVVLQRGHTVLPPVSLWKTLDNGRTWSLEFDNASAITVIAEHKVLAVRWDAKTSTFLSFYTPDAGAKWESAKYTLPSFAGDQVGAAVAAINTRLYALIAAYSTGMANEVPPIQSALLVSDDEGHTWARLASETRLPVPAIDQFDMVKFVGGKSDLAGATLMQIGSPYVAMSLSLDGSGQWIQTTLPVKLQMRRAPAVILRPVFWSLRLGVLPVVTLPFRGRQALLIYVTSDGGHSWQLGSTLTVTGISPVDAAQHVLLYAGTDGRGVLVVGNKIYTSTDSGRSWGAVTPGPTDITIGIDAIDLNAGLGWLIDSAGNVWQTHTDGRTWVKVSH